MNYEVKVLSLKRRIDRREYITNLIGKIYPFTFFDAIDGSEMNINYDIFKNSDYHLWNVNPNSVKAVALSNMEIWKRRTTSKISSKISHWRIHGLLWTYRT